MSSKTNSADARAALRFVTMETKEGADAAMQALNGKEIDGRALTVNEARPREDRPPRSGGGGGYRGGGGGGGRG